MIKSGSEKYMIQVQLKVKKQGIIRIEKIRCSIKHAKSSFFEPYYKQRATTSYTSEMKGVLDPKNN